MELETGPQFVFNIHNGDIRIRKIKTEAQEYPPNEVRITGKTDFPNDVNLPIKWDE